MEKSEYQQAWGERVSQIEEVISEGLIKGVVPEILIGTHRTLDELCEFLEVKPDWSNEQGRVIAFGDEGEIPIKIYRVVDRDLPYGVLIIK